MSRMTMNGSYARTAADTRKARAGRTDEEKGEATEQREEVAIPF